MWKYKDLRYLYACRFEFQINTLGVLVQFRVLIQLFSALQYWLFIQTGTKSSDGQKVFWVSPLIIFRFFVQKVALSGAEAAAVSSLSGCLWWVMTAGDRPRWKSETLDVFNNNVMMIAAYNPSRAQCKSVTATRCRSQMHLSKSLRINCSRSSIGSDQMTAIWRLWYPMVLPACVPRHNSNKVIMGIIRQSSHPISSITCSSFVTKTWGKNSCFVTVIPTSLKFKPWTPTCHWSHWWCPTKPWGPLQKRCVRAANEWTLPLPHKINMFRWNPCPCAAWNAAVCKGHVDSLYIYIYNIYIYIYGGKRMTRSPLEQPSKPIPLFWLVHRDPCALHGLLW